MDPFAVGRTGASSPPGVEPLLRILHEDECLLVLNKPAGLVCHPTKQDARSSLIGRVRLHLGDRARPHLLNRLDRETSGVVLVAKQDVAAREVRRLWENRSVDKEYWAIVHGAVSADLGAVNAPLGQDQRSRVAIKGCVQTEGAPSFTEYRVERRFHRDGQTFTWLRVWPRTGRKHQIRIHLAHLGHPIVGDKLYGANEDLYLALVEGRLTEEDRRQLQVPHHALHARAVRFVWRSEAWVFAAEAEGWFLDFLAAGCERTRSPDPGASPGAAPGDSASVDSREPVGDWCGVPRGGILAE